MFCNITLNSSNKKTKITAIIDTGNFLRDPITKIPVIVVEKDKLNELLPEIILDNVTNIINGKNVELGEYASKIRAIPFKSLGKENGLLLGVKVDEIEVSYQDMEHKIKDVIIGIYNGVLSRNGKYSGLIGLDIINSS